MIYTGIGFFFLYSVVFFGAASLFIINSNRPVSLVILSFMGIFICSFVLMRAAIRPLYTHTINKSRLLLISSSNNRSKISHLKIVFFLFLAQLSIWLSYYPYHQLSLLISDPATFKTMSVGTLFQLHNLLLFFSSTYMLIVYKSYSNSKNKHVIPKRLIILMLTFNIFTVLVSGFRSLLIDLIILLSYSNFVLDLRKHDFSVKKTLKAYISPFNVVVFFIVAVSAVYFMTFVTMKLHSIDDAKIGASRLFYRVFVLNADTNISFAYKYFIDLNNDYLLGKSLIWDFLGLMPGPDVAFAGWMTQKMNPQGVGVMTTTIIGESLANWGILGTMLIAFILPYLFLFASNMVHFLTYRIQLRGPTLFDIATFLFITYTAGRATASQGLGHFCSKVFVPIIFLNFLCTFLQGGLFFLKRAVLVSRSTGGAITSSN